MLLTSLSAQHGNTLAGPGDSLIVRRVLELTYPDNPITHTTIKFTNGCYRGTLPNNNSLLVSIDSISNIGKISGSSFPCIAAILKADSGNGINYTYLLLFQLHKTKIIPSACMYLGADIVLKNFAIDNGKLDIWWLRSFIGEDAKNPTHIMCRKLTLNKNKLVDSDFEKSQNIKRNIENDTVYTDSVTTGVWTIRWNKSRAIAFNNITASKKDIYQNKHADIVDYDGFMEHSVLEGFDPDWYCNTIYEMLSIVGPYVSFIRTFDIANNPFPSIEIKVIQLEGGTDSVSYFTQKESHKILGINEVFTDLAITDIFPKDTIFKQLMKNQRVLETLKEKRPVSLDDWYTLGALDHVINMYALRNHFAFTDISNDSVSFIFGSCLEIDFKPTGDFTTLELRVPIPVEYKFMFSEAEKKHGTVKYINPRFFIKKMPHYFNDSVFVKPKNIRKAHIENKKRQEFIQHVNTAQESLCFNELAFAQEEFSEALKIFPDDIHALFGRAKAAFKLNQTSYALNDCLKILSLDSLYAQAILYRGLCLFNLNRRDEALAALNRFYKIDSTNAPQELFRMRGEIYYMKKDYTEAFNNFSRYSYIRPSEIDIYLKRATAEFYIGKYKLVIDDLNNLFKYRRSDYMTLNLLGYALLHVQMYDSSISCFNKSLKMYRSEVDTYLGLAMAYYLQGNINEANKYFAFATSASGVIKLDSAGVARLEKANYYYSDEEKKYINVLYKFWEETRIAKPRKKYIFKGN
jgi:tetratricopeptide (TPR) repeat protein